MPRLDYLVAFEVAAELESFAAAARVLNVSETAVSRKIRLLELHYNCQLFLRRHRSVELTDQGRRLLGGIAPALKSLERVSLGLLSEQSRGTVRLAATNSVASLWLMPRLRDFRAEHRNITINLVSSDRDSECLAEDVELTILRGEGDWPGFDAQLLFGETVYPVCSPGYLETHGTIPDVAALTRHALIEVSNIHTEWLNWPTWLAQKDVDPDRIPRSTLVNTYPLGIQAAVDGLGVALGWGHLVDRHIRRGLLVRPLGTAHVRTHSGYYLLRRKDAPRHPERDIVAEWLIEESAARERYAAE